MIELSNKIYTAAQVRGLDRTAIEVYGMPGYELMCRAGEAALAALRRNWPDAAELTVVCGAGNNAGDGYVLARLALGEGYRVHVLALVAGERLGGDALRAYDDFVLAGGRAQPFAAEAGLIGDVVVDALLGTGLDRPVEGPFADAIAAINAAGSPVLALDVPSGLDADTGLALGRAVQADVTLTFVGLKQGLFLGDGIDYRGRLELADLGVPAQAHVEVAAPLQRLGHASVARALPRRPRTAHKGANGRLLLVGGAPGMAGAIRLAAEAALRVGAGLVRVATHPDSVLAVGAGRPEIMCHGVAEAGGLTELVAQSDALVLGPGLGRSAWAQSLWSAAIGAGRPLVVDADGLNLLASEPDRRGQWILTPHPGEAGRLLGRETRDVQADRLGAARELAARYAGIAVLKGAGTLIAAPGDEPVSVCDLGNPGMATAGMGDVLAGVIGGILVQCRDNRLAAEAGVLVHAAAGDEAAADGERGLLAGDLMAAIRRWANPV
jgi:NAD(P)H-hydrate epimerase